MPPKKLTLGFDTSAAHCAAALLFGDEIVAEALEPMVRGQVESLMPLLQKVLQAGGHDWKALTTIGVGIGPGNFTGIRISVAAARGLALSLGIPAVGVSTLEAQAFGFARPIGSLIDARRGQVYCQILDVGGGKPAQIMPLKDAHALINDLGIAGVGAGLDQPIGPVSVAIAKLAAKRSSLSPGRPAPLYIRPADAAPPRIGAPVILP